MIFQKSALKEQRSQSSEIGLHKDYSEMSPEELRAVLEETKKNLAGTDKGLNLSMRVKFIQEEMQRRKKLK